MPLHNKGLSENTQKGAFCNADKTRDTFQKVLVTAQNHADKTQRPYLSADARL